MNLSQITTLAADSTLLIYLVVIILLYGWIPSISDSFYRLPKKWNWVFSVVLWTVSILLMIGGGTNLMFLAGFFIMLVGAEPHFKDSKGEARMHYIYAVAGIGFGMLSMWLDFGLWELPIIFIGLSLILKLLKCNNLTFWVECLAVGIISLGILIK